MLFINASVRKKKALPSSYNAGVNYVYSKEVFLEVVARRYSVKKVLLKISLNPK